MVIPGRVHNGVVVLEGESALPEGAAVTITYPVPQTPRPAAPKQRIQVPLVRTDQPGSVHLTGARISEILALDAVIVAHNPALQPHHFVDRPAVE